MNISNQHKFVSFDITNLYTSVPIQATMNILKINLEKTGNLSSQEIYELLILLEVILKQNYFTFDNRFFIQEEGLAMGSPLSGLLVDIYLNYYENDYLLSMNNKLHNRIKFYKCYVDDTFVIFDGTTRQIHTLLNYMNNINTYIQFMVEIESNNEINFLDLTLIKQNNKFRYKISVSYTHLDVYKRQVYTN